MDAIELPAQTVEYLRNSVSSEEDLTSLDVEAALVPVGEEVDVEWTDAEWDDGEIRWLYTGTLPPGVYEHWIRVTGATEHQVRRTGLVLLI